MSGLSGVGSSTTGSGTTTSNTGTLGNVPPISFPGIASGIDYNAIIEKLTSLTLAQNQPLTAENTNLAAQNKELAKINGLIESVQGAIQNLGDPSLFNQFAATSSSSSFANAVQISGQTPQPGTYTILSQSLATSTVISSDPAANKPVNTNVTLATAGFQITPSDGTGSSGGKFTVDGQQITYDVGTDTVATILAKLNALTGVHATFQNDELTVTSTNGQPLSIGSASDSGNLEQIFKLDTSLITSSQQEKSAGTVAQNYASANGGLAAAGTDTLGGSPGEGVTDTGTLEINGDAANLINYNPTMTVTQLETEINGLPPADNVTASIVNGHLVIASTTGAPVTIADSNAGTGSFVSSFNGGIAPEITATDTLAGDGVTANGQLTVNGTAINYTTGETVSALETAINAISGVNASIQGGELVIGTTNNAALSVTETGAGNFLTTFNGGLSAAAGVQSVTSSSAVGGIDPNETLNLDNTSTALNSGTIFTINGVAISINPATMNLNDVISSINSSNAGVIASWNSTLGELQLVSKTTGPQSIVLGSPTDSSNFMQAFGLTTAGATTQVGQQASVTYQNAAGNSQTVYSNTNAVTNVIAGVTLNLVSNDTSTPYTITVAQSSTSLVSAINAFVKTYNAAINEINTASAPPVVSTPSPGTPLPSGSAESSVTVPGGVLFGNNSVSEMKNQLVQMVSDLYQNGSTSYNSFSAIGLMLDSSVSVISSDSTAGNSDSSDSDGGLQEQTFDGTSGQLQALDTSTFDAALAADPAAVQSLFTSNTGVLGQVGTYLTFVTGTPTSLGPNNPYLAQVPDTSLLQSIETSNSNQIDSINQQIAIINDEATAQANQLRAQFNASETLIAQLQAEQQSLSSILGSSSTTSSS
ncbi:MAG: flagellar filament capping protein FliD [Vulcanimicrobiaceae bacterium]|jgi:flagellar capping protein FliD